MKAPSGKDIVSLAEASELIVSVGQPQHAGVVFLRGFAVPFHESRAFRRQHIQFLGEPAGLVERPEIVGILLQRAQIEIEGLARGHPGGNARVGEITPGMGKSEAEAAKRQRVFRRERDAAPPGGQPGVLAVVVPLAAAEQIPEIV